MFLRTKNSIPDQKSMYFALNSGKNETIKASDYFKNWIRYHSSKFIVEK